MAEILVRWKDNVNAESGAKDAMCYKRGDPVVVMPDGHRWGRKEGPPDFRIVKLPGVDHVALRDRLTEPERSDLIFDSDGEGVMTKRRACWLDVTRLRKAEADALDAGEVTLSARRAEDVFRAKLGDASVTLADIELRG